MFRDPAAGKGFQSESRSPAFLGVSRAQGSFRSRASLGFRGFEGSGFRPFVGPLPGLGFRTFLQSRRILGSGFGVWGLKAQSAGSKFSLFAFIRRVSDDGCLVHVATKPLVALGNLPYNPHSYLQTQVDEAAPNRLPLPSPAGKTGG